MRKVETCTVTQLAHESDVDDVAQVSCLSLALHADLAVSVRRSLQPRIHALEAGSRKCTADQFMMLKQQLRSPCSYGASTLSRHEEDVGLHHRRHHSRRTAVLGISRRQKASMTTPQDAEAAVV
jgi:hypothetical protein